MAIVKNNYSTLQVIDPYYITIEQSAAQADLIIVIDTINNNEPGKINVQLTGDVIWLQMEVGHILTVLSGQPNGITAFTPSVEYLNKARLRLKTAEVFVIEYNSTAKDDSLHRTAVTGYQMGTYDKAVIKLDTKNDLITVYQM